MHTTAPQQNEASKATPSTGGTSIAGGPLQASQSKMLLQSAHNEEADAIQMRQDPLQPKESHQNPLQPVSYSNPFQRKDSTQNPLRPIKYDNPFQRRANGQNPFQVTDYTTNPLQRKEVKKETTIQPKKENNTGLPDNLKAGVESLSGYSMDDVKVHYNSDKPAQLQALAYAQGTDIHIAPGQEQHLPHEAWHVVQQKQGRVQPTMQMKGDIPVNDDKGLENEADVMEAIQSHDNINHSNVLDTGYTDIESQQIIQRVIIQGADGDYRSPTFKNKGMEMLMSPLEIENGIDILTKQVNQKLINVDDIPKNLKWDDVNYFIGHAEADRGLMGYTAEALRKLLLENNFPKGAGIYILACNGDKFANDLSKELADNDNKVVAACGLSYEFWKDAGAFTETSEIEEMVIDESKIAHIPEYSNRSIDYEIKITVARKYDNKLLNFIVQSVSEKFEIWVTEFLEQLDESDKTTSDNLEFGLNIFSAMGELSVNADKGEEVLASKK